MNFEKLIQIASSLPGKCELSPTASAGSVKAALITGKGNIYTGICLDTACSLGFCAEHAAIAQMITAGESRIEMIAAVKDGAVLPPCGRCRELISQINPDNKNSLVMLPENQVVKLRELIPHDWKS